MIGAKRSFLGWREIPGGVWALGVVSMLMDLSSEMIHALLPLYLVTVLGASMLTVGMIEGVAEAIAMVTKIFSGALSDYHRQAQAACSYGIRSRGLHQARVSTRANHRLAGSGAVRRPRRQGHPWRPARRAHCRSLAGGLCAARVMACGNRSTRSVRFLDHSLAMLLMLVLADNFTTVFWIAVIPAFASFAVILFWVSDPDRPATTRAASAPAFVVVRAKRMGARLLAGGEGCERIHVRALAARRSCCCARSRSESPLALVPVVMVIMNVVYAVVGLAGRRLV